MDREETEKLVERYGLSYWSFDEQQLLLAIMSKLLEIEERVERLEPIASRPSED